MGLLNYNFFLHQFKLNLPFHARHSEYVKPNFGFLKLGKNTMHINETVGKYLKSVFLTKNKYYFFFLV